MLRTVLLACLVAAIKADADAEAYYAPYHLGAYAYGAYPYAYGAYHYGVPFGSSTGLDPITQGLDPVTQGAVIPGHYIGKRSADADAEAYYAPYAYGAYAYGAYPYAYGAYHYGVPFGSSTGLDPITQGLDAVTQGAVIPGHYIGKRSADADAEAYYAPYAYGAYAYGAYPYAYGAYHYGVPFGSSTGLDPITQGLDPVTQGAVVGHYIGKRSADAEAEADADAEAYYAPYAYGAYAHGAYPYAYGAYAYGAYPYAYGGYPYAYGAYNRFGYGYYH